MAADLGRPASLLDAVLYTDGLVEMRARPGAPRRLEIEGLIARVETADGTALTRDDLCDLVAAMAAQSGEGPADDVAIVTVSRSH